jgi:hypothetical protein
MFAGWWLATSSMTGPRVRAAADKVRQRIDELRGTPAGGDAEEQTETFWSSETGWQDAGSEQVGGPLNEQSVATVGGMGFDDDMARGTNVGSVETSEREG